MSLLSHLSNYPFAKNVHIKIIYDSSSDQIRYTHQLEEGRLEEGAHYGIALAKTILPAELVEDAVKMADIFSAAEDRIAHAFQSRDGAQQSDKTLEHTYVNVAQRLEDLSHYYQNMSTDELRNFLLALRSQLVERWLKRATRLVLVDGYEIFLNTIFCQISVHEFRNSSRIIRIKYI